MILGLETSCDETSAAVVEDGRLVRSNVVSSQIDLHARFGGVVPEIASRQHIRAIAPAVNVALAGAGIERADVDLVAATHGPGLAGALLVGLNFGRGFALGLGRPFVPINHLEGHIHSVWLDDPPGSVPEPELPLLVLIVSGGHTELVLMTGHGEYERLGSTLDDAAGEAFDKVARLLGLAYPGGPAIESAARQATAPVRVPRAWLPGTHDFSFSGLKTAMLHEVRKRSGNSHVTFGADPAGIEEPLLDADTTAALAAGFQESVVDVLCVKTAQAARELNVSGVAVVGGVAANQVLRAHMREVIDLPLYVSPPQFATDNAAMIAAAAYYLPRQDVTDIDALPSLRLGA